ncbi:hypothetical protein KW783_03660 [Candidatus Parcubacteria bacterium]|nr:hypothetical protein [Candidatus Parcubacteria bacterium]
MPERITVADPKTEKLIFDNNLCVHGSVLLIVENGAVANHRRNVEYVSEQKRKEILQKLIEELHLKPDDILTGRIDIVFVDYPRIAGAPK